MKELKQFKCLGELKKIIDEISARARPVMRDSMPRCMVKDGEASIEL